MPTSQRPRTPFHKTSRTYVQSATDRPAPSPDLYETWWCAGCGATIPQLIDRGPDDVCACCNHECGR